MEFFLHFYNDDIFGEIEVRVEQRVRGDNSGIHLRWKI